MTQLQKNIPNTSELSEESERFWDKMQILRQRFKDQVSCTKSAEEKLAKVNLELSLVKNENCRLNKTLEEQKSSINKYQQILKDLVEIEDRYCKLLVEKKKTDEELSSEKKLRLSVQSRWNIEKLDLQRPLQDELRIMKEHAINQERTLKNEYMKMIEEQKLQINSLNQENSQARKKNEEETLKMKQDLIKAQREISRLKTQLRGQEKVTIVNNVTLKPIVQEGTSGTRIQAVDTERTEMASSNSMEYIFEEETLEKDRGVTNLRQNRQLEAPSPAWRSVLLNELSSSHPHNNSKSHSEGTFIATSKQHQQYGEPQGGKKCNPLEVFKVPSRISRKAPLKKKRKLYSRSDDTI